MNYNKKNSILTCLINMLINILIRIEAFLFHLFTHYTIMLSNYRYKQRISNINDLIYL